MKCYTFPPGISRARLYDDSLDPRPMNSRYVVADGSYAIDFSFYQSLTERPCFRSLTDHKYIHVSRRSSIICALRI